MNPSLWFSWFLSLFRPPVSSLAYFLAYFLNVNPHTQKKPYHFKNTRLQQSELACRQYKQTVNKFVKALQFKSSILKLPIVSVHYAPDFPRKASLGKSACAFSSFVTKPELHQLARERRGPSPLSRVGAGRAPAAGQGQRSAAPSARSGAPGHSSHCLRHERGRSWTETR